MKKTILTTVMLLISLFGFCKSQRDLFHSMPDSLLPVLNANLRLEMLELHDMHVKAEITNLLGGNTCLDTLSNDYLRLNVDSIMTVDVCMLSCNQGDSILCVIKTLGCDDGESDVTFYDQQWRMLDGNIFWEHHGIHELTNELLIKPDTMTQQRFDDLGMMIEPNMVHAEFNPQTKSMKLSLSLPMISNEDKKYLNAILMQREFKWNGSFFKKD